MEICNREVVSVQLVKEYQEFQRELKYKVAKEALEYKKLMVKR